MKVLSLGAGVQSTTLLVMACNGDFERPDHVIFADTGWEPVAVYSHLEKLKVFSANHGISIDVVRKGNLRNDALDHTHRFASMPLFTKSADGKVSMLQRQCTREYKLGPILARVRELGATKSNPAEMWIGISTDEIVRMKDSRVQYTGNRWPLIERGMDRNACRKYLDDAGWSQVPKSSCIGCPFHDDNFWNRLKIENKDEFEDAALFDEAVRNNQRLRDPVFIHRSGRPIRSVVFSSDVGQGDLFNAECGGMCGV